MKASELAELLNAIVSQYGDADVQAFPGWDTSYPVTPETVEYYGKEITDEPYILITGSVPELP